MLQNWKNLTRLVKRSLITSKYLSAKDDDKTKKTNKVKLYPGYQASHEELQQSLLNEDSSSVQNFYDFFLAKKVIEDFYGLNELEYEKEDISAEVSTERKIYQEASELEINYLLAIK
ncbi:hypothetical protein BpHYR1_046687 [Brachionus plicatilis]|uniref:Uncharacterized protein n=1 Tax=Brachionus plicatilis TaxID=10195 RepID=A0A3M7RVF0_BRAPC|nr:hypothetical protein BpHYR1_046687 [Brachionus plicatilis]